MATPAGLRKPRYNNDLDCLTSSYRDIEPESVFGGLSNRGRPPYPGPKRQNHNEKAAGAGTHGGSQIVRGFGKTTTGFYHDDPSSTSRITLLDKWRLACQALRDPSLSAIAKCVFVLLLETHHSNTDHCSPSIAGMGAKLDRGRDAMFEAVRALEENGWLRVRRTRGSRSSYIFAWERLPAPAGSHAAPVESGGEIPTTDCTSEPPTGREIPTPTSRENTTLIQRDNKKDISQMVEMGLGLTSSGSQPGPVVRSEIELPSTPEETFDQFWHAFPKKEGRAAAQREWSVARAAGAPASLLLVGAQQYARKCAGREMKWIASPTNWLRGQRWLDEPDRSTRTAPAAAPPPDDEIARAVREALAPRARDDDTWVFVPEGSPEWGRWIGAVAHARAHIESGVRRLVQTEAGTFERKLGRYFPTSLPPSPSRLEATSHG